MAILKFPILKFVFKFKIHGCIPHMAVSLIFGKWQTSEWVEDWVEHLSLGPNGQHGHHWPFGPAHLGQAAI